MNAQKFLSSCESAKLKVKVNVLDEWRVDIEGDDDASRCSALRALIFTPLLEPNVILELAKHEPAEYRRWEVITDEKLKELQDLTAQRGYVSLLDLIEERAAIRQAEGLPGDLLSAVQSLMKKQEIKGEPVKSEVNSHLFIVENQQGERFNFAVSCIDEALPDALKGLKVIQEIKIEKEIF
ncbi:MAG: hypothetical protein IJP88_01925 [Synergistaceae bacterium]|nr:hypothetical protein [Synergistaceae bacterium]MBR0095921.1 hypothetical protein [Synergistaceae bacterium]